LSNIERFTEFPLNQTCIRPLRQVVLKNHAKDLDLRDRPQASRQLSITPARFPRRGPGLQAEITHQLSTHSVDNLQKQPSIKRGPRCPRIARRMRALLLLNHSLRREGPRENNRGAFLGDRVIAPIHLRIDRKNINVKRANC
jgi:hypothetical protein